MPRRQKVTRRAFLRASASLTAATLLAACAQPTPTPTKAPTVVPTAATKATVAPTTVPTQPPAPTAAPKAAVYKEAPMLAELVKAGKLPPVEQRLPKDPQVIQPVEKVGRYGGTLRFGDAMTSLWSTACLRTHGLFRYNQAGSEVFVDIAKSYKWSTDLKTLTIELREGHKWSDGTPFTVDDILFLWEDVNSNKDLTPAFPSFWAPGGKPVAFRKVSPTIVEMTFAVPYPVALDYLGRSSISSDPSFLLPKHYLQKWHLKYNPKANDVAKEEKFDDWTRAFRAHLGAGNYFDVGRPRLWSWIPEAITTDRAVAVRNPYFHQVDTEGNQLPYIDRVNVTIVSDRQVMLLKATAGEFDLETYFIDITAMAVFKQNQEKGNYRILLPRSARISAAALQFNRHVKDAVLNDLFNKKDFRLALSIAINRDAINNAVMFGLGTPTAVTCHPGMSFYKPEWRTMNIEYDPTRANQLLDALGLTKKDSEGYRLRPDGQGRINILCEISAAGEGPKMAMCEMVAADWKKAGVELVVKAPDDALLNQRNLAGECQMVAGHVDRSGLFGRAYPLWFGWDAPTSHWWGNLWAQWFQTAGKQGVEPPEEIKKLRDLFEQYRQTLPGTPEFNKLGAQYYEYFPKEIPSIGTVGLQPQPMIVNNKLRNVPEKDCWWTSDTNFYAPYVPPQWYFET